MNRSFRPAHVAAAAIAGALAVAALAQAPERKAPANPAIADAPGQEVYAAKCFQCHGANMFIAQRQDRRGWESTLYRMVGRGALWTEDEIKAMAEYLATTYGKESK
jgi:mono/diheme cytochrome c family protein